MRNPRLGSGDTGPPQHQLNRQGPMWEGACSRWRWVSHLSYCRHTAIGGKPPPTLNPVCSVDVGVGRYRQTPTSGSSFRHIQAPRHSPRRLGETHAETSLSPAAKPLKTMTKTPENLFKNQALPPEVFSFCCHRKLRNFLPMASPLATPETRPGTEAMASCKSHLPQRTNTTKGDSSCLSATFSRYP